MHPEKFYIHFKGKVIELTKNSDALWCDETGCIYALPDVFAMTDTVARIGVWPFTFPEGTVLDDAAKIHDYMYSCPAYQFFYSREEADRELRKMWKEATSSGKGLNRILRVFVEPFYQLTRVFGERYWENKKNK